MSISREELDASEQELDNAIVVWLDTLASPLLEFKEAYRGVGKKAISYAELLIAASKEAPQEVAEDYMASARHVTASVNFALKILVKHRLAKGLPADIFRVDR